MKKKLLSGLTVVFFVLFSVSLASAANTWYVAPSPAGTGTSGGSCAAPGYNTISAAITAAGSGDTINVCAGTYNENQILITKPLTIIGAGNATTIINGGDAALATDGLISITATGDVTFSGFTLRNAGGTTFNYDKDGLGVGIDGGDNKINVGIYAQSSSSSATFTITNNVIYGTNNADDEEDYGLYADGGHESLNFHNNMITQTGSNPILIETNPGPTDVSYNTLDEGVYGTVVYFSMTYGGVDVTTLQKVSNNNINLGSGNHAGSDYLGGGIVFRSSFQLGGGDGKYSNIQITGNTITNVLSYRRGISLSNDATGDGTAGEISSPVITGNTIIANPGTTNNIGIQLRGLVSNADVQYNTINNFAQGFYGAIGPTSGSTGYPTGTVLNFNNIFGNSIGLKWDGSDAFNAIKNWWGSSTGPGPIGPGSGDKITGNVNYDPWLCAPYPTSWVSVNGKCISPNVPTLSPIMMIFLISALAFIGAKKIKV